MTRLHQKLIVAAALAIVAPASMQDDTNGFRRFVRNITETESVKSPKSTVAQLTKSAGVSELVA